MPPIFINRRQVLTLAATTFANAAARTEERAHKTFPKFSRGINFHHVLNWPALQTQSGKQTYVWPPFTGDKYKLRAEDLALVVSLGFDFVRLTVDPGLWIAEGPRHEGELERHYLDSVETLLAANLNVVFDLASVENHPDYSPTRLISSEDPEKLAPYAVMVGRAARLLSRTPYGRVALELFNEPPLGGDTGEACWAVMQKQLHTRAREVAPDLALILTAAQWGDSAALTRLDISAYRASNVIYTFHYYEPHLFTHQGTKTGAISYVSGLDWPLTAERAKQAEGDAEQAIAGDAGLDIEAQARLRDEVRQTFAGGSARPHNEAVTARDFDEVAAWAQANGIAAQQVLLGEFGCVLASRGRPTGEARLRWLSAVRRAAEARGFGWAYWAFKGYGGMELLDQDGAIHADLVVPLGLRAPR